MTEKSVFREAWSPELTSTIVTSLLFLVSRFCTPPEVKFDAFGTSKHGEGKSLSKKYIFATLISSLGRFSRANKKTSVIYTLKCYYDQKIHFSFSFRFYSAKRATVSTRQRFLTHF